jgi:hypothetical protein
MAKFHIATFLSLLFLLASCRGPLPTTIDAIDKTWGVIQPEYIGYIDADQSITDDSKATRIRTAVLMSKLIETAKESYQREKEGAE